MKVPVTPMPGLKHSGRHSGGGGRSPLRGPVGRLGAWAAPSLFADCERLGPRAGCVGEQPQLCQLVKWGVLTGTLAPLAPKTHPS